MRLLLFTSIYLLVIPNFALSQRAGEQITYDSQKGIYLVRYWSIADSTFYSVPLFPGNKHIPNVRGSVILNDKNEYLYSYTISNSENAVRELYNFSIHLQASVQKIKNPNDEWRGDFVSWMERVSWTQANSKSDTIGILPGEEVRGEFSFVSNFIPGIATAFTSSYRGLGNTVDEGPSGKIRKKVNSLLDSTKYISFKTVAPQKLPENIGSTALLDTLHSYLSFSCDTTWIPAPGVCRSLRFKLEESERHLAQGRPRPAREVLQAFLDEVEALSEAQLSPEARALLYHNGRFLLGKLEEER